MTSAELDKIFKSYDIRGVFGSELTLDTVEKIGQAWTKFLDTHSQPQQVVVGYDARNSTPQVFEALVRGINSQGYDVIDIGQVSTDTVYYASGKFELPAVMITASHNPAEYNGLKFALSGAKAVAKQDLQQIKQKVQTSKFKTAKSVGQVEQKNILADYIQHIRSFVKMDNLQPLKVVIDAGNGMAGKIAPLLFAETPLEIVPMYFELDGDFPNHPANPIESANIKQLKEKVIQQEADFGMAFDGDGDRVFFVDANGETVSSSTVICLVVKNLLNKKPNSKILYNAVCSKIVPETIQRLGGEPIRERVGHSYIKQTMRQEDILFGGEHSGHYFYKDNFFADSAFITAMLVWEIMSLERIDLQSLAEEYNKYYMIEETNFEVADKQQMTQLLKDKYSHAQQSELDGLTVEFKNWWFNVRPSGTEPLLRLNLEAESQQLAEQKKTELTEFIEQHK